MPVPGGTLTLSSGNWTDLVQTAFDLEAEKYLREEPIFRPFADKRPTRQAHPGDVVTLTITGELALATTPLSENLDVDAVAMPANRQLNVTLVEYGNAVVDTHFLRKTDFTQDTAARIGEELGLNAARSIDKIYQNVLDATTKVAYVDNTGALKDGALPAAGTSTGVITSKSISTAKALLRRRNSMPRFGNTSACVVHPDVAHDLYSESGTNTWKQPHEQVDTSNIYNRTLGDYMGVRFFENSKSTVTLEPFGANPDTYIYNSYFIDKQALVEVVADDVRTVVADPIDALKRFYRAGWYALLGVSRYRENAQQLVKSQSSIATTYFAGALPTYDGKA